MLSVGMRQHHDPDISPEAFDTIGRVLKARFGFTLEGYKDKCIKRRIHIRMRTTKSPSADEYSTLLIESGAEQEQLLRVLTIHVSQFFRNPSTFEKLSGEILPALAARRGTRGVRILSVGCAAGEEPYSIALMVRERFPQQVAAGEIAIDAVDVDQACIDCARAGLYHADRLAEVAPELKSRWFAREGEKFRLSEEVRSLVSFRQADLNDMKSCPESDLIVCRNVLIYFERSRQEAILNLFADALGEGGYLVLGKSETLFGSARKRFRTVCPTERVYQINS